MNEFEERGLKCLIVTA